MGSEPSLGPTPQLTAAPDPLTHWARPGIGPTSSWILVGFVTAEPQCELLSQDFLNFTCALVLACFHPVCLGHSWPLLFWKLMFFSSWKWSWINLKITLTLSFLCSHSSTTVILNWTSWTSPLIILTRFLFFSLLLPSFSLPLPAFTLALFCFLTHLINFHRLFLGGGEVPFKNVWFRVPVVAQRKWIRLGTKRLRVWSLASFRGLRIQKDKREKKSLIPFYYGGKMFPSFSKHINDSFLFVCLFVFLPFLGPHPWHMEAPRLGV